ncbi:MAG: hypothetical protein RMJ87_00605 [Cytophagales bacterium]|nr:hypothetical protein [Bernardetiaceae bacterium]MDW8203501.1 hypothetical protein [Cytophagales bacterium]
MLAHPFIIALLLSQFAVATIIVYAAWKGIYALRYWSDSSFTSLQLTLEREHYLLGAIVQTAMVAQLAGLGLFVWLINNYLPHLVRGAMCGAGVLSANQYGYLLLYVKMATPPLYVLYLLLQYLDNQAPDYPLTPFKYYLLLPTAAAVAVETWLMWMYSYRLEPDVIVTCCSANFLVSQPSYANFLSVGKLLQPALWTWGLIGALLIAADWQKPFLPTWVHSLLILVFVGLSIYTLKYFFVKYIYGVPSHLCLFDLFLAHHHYIGYLIFALYYILIISTMLIVITPFVIKKTRLTNAAHLQTWANIRLVALLLSMLIPLAYRTTWWHGIL